jgi:tetratricopeptide (TPR) repeat protein
MSARRARSQKRQSSADSRPHGSLHDVVEDMQRDIDSLRQQADLHDRDIHDIRATEKEKDKHWYQRVDSAIPVLTFIFSLTTFLISAYWSSNQHEAAETRLEQEERQSARADLRILLQQLYDLDTREGEVLASDTPSSIELSNIYAEMALLATQARDAADRAEEGVSSTEYLAVAWYLYRSGDNESAGRLYRDAIDAAGTAIEDATAHRTYGAFLMNTGRLAEGRQQFALALRVDERFPVENPSFLATIRAEIEMRWAETELSHQQCAQADEHFRKSQDLLDAGGSPATSGWRLNIAQLMEGWEERVGQCQPPDP